MSDVTPERLAELRALAEAATPGPWEIDSHTHYDVAPPAVDWQIVDLERWRGYTNNVGFGEDEATARYVAGVSPDVVTALLDEIERLRNSSTSWPRVASEEIDAFMAAIKDPEPVRSAAATEPDGVVDLMAALEQSIAAAKDSRGRHPQQGSEQ